MIKEPKLTEWFPADVEPAQPGVYEVLPTWWHTPARWFRYWDGSRWHNGHECPSGAATIKATIRPGMASEKWRGLAEPPQ